MTHSAFENSARQGRPVELFEFIQGAQTWRFTAYDQDYTWNTHTWTAETIGGDEPKQSGKVDQAGISLRFPSTNAFAAAFLSGLVEQITTVTVWRGHVGDPDEEFEVSWMGRVVGGAADGPEIQLQCESLFTSLRRFGLRRAFQKPCPHAVYGRGCNLAQANFAEGPFSISAMDGRVVTIPDAALQPDGWYTGGKMVAADGSQRFIMEHTGDSLVISRTHPTLEGQVAGGVSVTLYPGCDHTESTCNSKFSNGLNFGGWKYFGPKNPMGGSSIV